MHTAGNKIIARKYRCYAVQNMIISFLYIIRYHIFKRQHTINIKISCSCNQILCIGILSSKLITYKMAPVIQIFTINIIVFCCLPSRRFYFTNCTTFLSRHNVFTYISKCSSTSSKFIQFSVTLK